MANAAVFGLKSAPMQSITRNNFSQLLAAAMFFTLAPTGAVLHAPHGPRGSREPLDQTAAS